MPMEKVELAASHDDSARKSRFNRRKKGLFKKLEQLSILCDVKACAIVYGPNDRYPEVWPSVHDAHHVLSQLKSIRPLAKKARLFDHAKYFQKLITKVKERLEKKKRENRASEINQILRGKGLQDVLNEDLVGTDRLLQEKMLSIQKRIDHLRRGVISEPPEETRMPIPMQMKVQTPMPGAMQTEVSYVGSVGEDWTSAVLDDVGATQENQWFNDVMNPPYGHSYYVADDLMMPYGDNGSLHGAPYGDNGSLHGFFFSG